MTAAGVRYPPRAVPLPRRQLPPPKPPSISGQLLPSRSLRALRAVLDRYRQEVAA